jgi:hypothetical protein
MKRPEGGRTPFFFIALFAVSDGKISVAGISSRVMAGGAVVGDIAPPEEQPDVELLPPPD